MMMHSSPPRPFSRKRKPPTDDDDTDQLRYQQQQLQQLPNPAVSATAAALAASPNNNTPWTTASPKRLRSGALDPEMLLRLQQAHNSTTLPQPPIRKLLSMLPTDQLAGIICSLIDSHPALQHDLIALIPRPSLTTAGALLERAEKAMIESFPYSKLGRVTTSYSFNRVRPQLEELKDLLVYFLDFFVLPTTYPNDLQHEYPAVAFGYLDMAATLVHRLPRWQDPMHEDATRGMLYRRLGHAWRVAVGEVARRTRDGKIFGATPVAEWADSLHRHSTQVDGNHGFKEASQEFRESLGWVIGMDDATSSSRPGPALLV
ncbi:hypothetical protein PhCBS80983_g05959 [Powellomyces hirtus]|uniref:Tethering factor for nuclear proteasome STS1 n=1 Tax=Powellomyces hirtus TaxID=109895 RepID=A0A507DS76_9FUNG|nr:hypothetical protein PhCBS80983_g05959 [Powellomyces hirtus]